MCGKFVTDQLLNGKNPELIFRSTRDGQTGNAYHSKCDEKENLLTIIKATSGRIFGGSQSMLMKKGGDKWISDPSAYIFSVSDSKKFALKNENGKHAFYNHKDLGPRFGGGADIGLAKDFTSQYN